MLRQLTFALVLASAVALAAAPVHATCSGITATVTAEVATDPEFAGFYKYCVTWEWEGGYPLDNSDLYVSLPNLSCSCDDELWTFDDPAGSATDSHGETCEYPGEFQCAGNHNLPYQIRHRPAIKFNADFWDCHLGATGEGMACFYSQFAPGDYQVHRRKFVQKAWINQYNYYTCKFDLEGQLPAPSCSVATHQVNWSNVKARFQ